MNTDLLARIDEACSDAVRPAAPEVDTGVFPTAPIQALREAGALDIEDLPTAVLAVQRIAQDCASTAMVTCMHLSSAAALRACGHPVEGLATLAFSEAGSRSHFWAPVSTARSVAGGVRLDAKKSWVTSAHHATTYVWSSQPLGEDGASTLWAVPASSKGLSTPGAFDGLGLRGNDSTPILAEGVVVPESARLGPDGGGFDLMMGTVLPWFNLMSAGCATGIAEAAVSAAATHAGGTRYQHLDSALRELPTIRAYLAKSRCQVDASKALLLDALNAVGAGRPDTMLRVLQAKAHAAETALQVTATSMRVCGGAAFRKEVGVERNFRDAQAASVMAPTTDVLYDFIGKAITGMELF